MSEVLVAITLSVTSIAITIILAYLYYTQNKEDKVVEKSQDKEENLSVKLERLAVKNEDYEKRIEKLENNVDELKEQLREVKQTADFARKHSHEHGIVGKKV